MILAWQRIARRQGVTALAAGMIPVSAHFETVAVSVLSHRCCLSGVPAGCRFVLGNMAIMTSIGAGPTLDCQRHPWAPEARPKLSLRRTCGGCAAQTMATKWFETRLGEWGGRRCPLPLKQGSSFKVHMVNLVAPGRSPCLPPDRRDLQRSYTKMAMCPYSHPGFFGPPFFLLFGIDWC